MRTGLGRVSRPVVAAALRTDPELIGLPGSAARRVSQVHLFAAALAAHVNSSFAHGENSIVVVSFQSSVFSNVFMVIPGIVLAAGRSSRMGRTKALLPIGQHDTFLSRVTRTLRDGGVEEVIVVVGADADADRIRAAMAREKMPARVVENPDYEQGQITSLIAALRTIDRPGVTAALVTLIDAPLVAAATVQTLLREYRAGAGLIVRPASKGRHGHPVIFDRALFDELRRASPKEGAKEVVRAYAAEVFNVEVEDEGAFTDIDTPEDYERWIGKGSGLKA